MPGSAYQCSTLRRLLLAEGGLVATCGAILGVGAGLFYAWLMLYGLATFWSGAIAGAAIRFHATNLTLLLGGTFRLGAALGGDTFGLALCTALQTLALAGSMALCIAFLAREGAPRALRLGLTVFFALVPMAMV